MLQRLIGDLKSDDPKTLHDALQGLTSLKSKASGAVDAIAGLLADDRTLTVPSRNIIGHASFQVNLTAVATLGSIGRPAVEALLAAMENNKNSAVRQRAAEVLAAIGQPVESKHWIRALANSDPNVRVIAAKQLGKRKEVQGIEVLCKA